MNDFISRLLFELERSLRGTFGVFRSRGGDTTGILVDILSALIVSLLLGLIFVVSYLLLRALLRFAFARLGIGPFVSGPVLITLRFAAIALAAIAIMAQLGLEADVITAASRAAAIALAFYLGWIVGVRILTRLLGRHRVDRSIIQLLRNVLSVMLLTFGLVGVMAQFGVDILAVLATLGVVGIAVGFAAQSTLANFIAGVTLLIERPFRIGDWVEIHGQVGKVEEITLRTTHLITRDNVHTLIPNDSVASSDIINFSLGGPLRIRINLGIAYKESVREAREVLMPVVKAHPSVMVDRPPHLIVTELNDSSVDLEIRCWIDTADIDLRTRIKAAILESCKEALDEAGIQIPFPHRQLFIDDAKGLEPLLDRRRGPKHDA